MRFDDPPPARPSNLASYPYVIVRIGCPQCRDRQGSYRLARLAAKFGPETPLDEVLDRIAMDCVSKICREKDRLICDAILAI